MKRLKANRSWILVFLLTLVTLGIYSLYLIKVMARDTNIACSKDGKKTSGLLKYILLSLFTLGIYSIVWDYSILSRWKTLAENSGEQPKLSPNKYILLFLFGPLIVIGPFIIAVLKISGLNQMCFLYNETIPEEKIDPSKNNWGWKFN